MAGSELEGHSILIVEDEFLVAMDIADAFGPLLWITSWDRRTVHLCAPDLMSGLCRS